MREIAVGAETLVGLVSVERSARRDLGIDVIVKLLSSPYHAVARRGVADDQTALIRRHAELVGKLIDEMRSGRRRASVGASGAVRLATVRRATARDLGKECEQRRDANLPQGAAVVWYFASVSVCKNATMASIS